MLGSKDALWGQWLASVGMAVICVSCDSAQQLRVASAGQTGCAPQQIEITDDVSTFSSRSWVAWCGAKPYQCSATSNSVSCKGTPEEKDPPPKRKPKQKSEVAWASREVRECGVSADFPAPPAEMRERAEGSTRIFEATLELPNGAGAMSVSCSAQLPKKASAQGALDGARDGMLNRIGARLVKEREILGGREVLFELKGEQGMARLLFIDQRIVVVLAIPVSAFGAATAKRFLNSVELLEQR